MRWRNSNELSTPPAQRPVMARLLVAKVLSSAGL